MSNKIVTRGMGGDIASQGGYSYTQQLVTRGYGRILVILKPRGGGTPTKIFRPEDWVQKTDEIRTRYILVPDQQDEIMVDVLLLSSGEDPESAVQAALDSMTYSEVRVYSVDEVVLYDRNPDE